MAYLISLNCYFYQFKETKLIKICFCGGIGIHGSLRHCALGVEVRILSEALRLGGRVDMRLSAKQVTRVQISP